MRICPLSAWLTLVVATFLVVGSAHTHRSARNPSQENEQDSELFGLNSSLSDAGIAAQADGVMIEPLTARMQPKTVEIAQPIQVRGRRGLQGNFIGGSIIKRSLGYDEAISMKPQEYFQVTYAKLDWADNEPAIRLYINLWGSFANSFRFEYVEEPTVFDFRVTCERSPIFDIQQYIKERDIRKVKIIGTSHTNDLESALKGVKKDEERVIQVPDQVLGAFSKKDGLFKLLTKLHIRMIMSEESLYLWIRQKVGAEKGEKLEAKLEKVNEFSKEGQSIRATPLNIVQELVRKTPKAR
ncbi:hypothetical protein FA10DRAFT_257552 [Acaromyces ingoldii]|uniref:Uncharacterized protein n=1 Tax=Acaromyces ingoldii TaxID=215250 RepID=A0A316YVQ6_9BASI|nr:hypothetical protein FA10DRAFT_257552 [Acaromyces ingoldii]PWN93212.1 hypothetical protein FA10DRAFT_257552 [Acaromyces ingoldii]